MVGLAVAVELLGINRGFELQNALDRTWEEVDECCISPSDLIPRIANAAIHSESRCKAKEIRLDSKRL